MQGDTGDEGAIHGHNSIWRKVCYVFFELWIRSITNFMLLLPCTFWNVKHLLSKNQRRR